MTFNKDRECLRELARLLHGSYENKEKIIEEIF